MDTREQQEVLVKSMHIKPANHGEMLKRPEEERNKQLEGTNKEFKDFDGRRVLRIVKIEDTLEGEKLMGCEWVCKSKKNGTHRSKLVPVGHTQMSRVDHQDIFG